MWLGRCADRGERSLWHRRGGPQRGGGRFVGAGTRLCGLRRGIYGGPAIVGSHTWRPGENSSDASALPAAIGEEVRLGTLQNQRADSVYECGNWNGRSSFALELPSGGHVD